jgi:chromosome segregation ATPase
VKSNFQFKFEIKQHQSFSCSVKTGYEKMINELNREMEAQRSQLQDHGNMQKTSPIRLTTKNAPTSGTDLASQKEQREAFIRALADIRGDMVKIADGNIKAMSEDDKQNVTVQALINNKTGQLQEKIDDYEAQIQNLKRELKAQKALAQQHIDEAADARGKLGKIFFPFKFNVYKFFD